MGKARELAALEPKKKCCRSSPRCKRCPFVVHAVRRAERRGLSGKALRQVFKEARRRRKR